MKKLTKKILIEIIYENNKKMTREDKKRLLAYSFHDLSLMVTDNEVCNYFNIN